MYPEEEQKPLLAQHFGAKRFVWNRFLEERKKTYLETGKSLNYYDNALALTQLKKDENFEWLKQINSQSSQASLRDLDVAYDRFFKHQSAFPKFKSRHNKQSFRIPQFVTLEGNQLWIPKFKKSLKVRVHRPLEGKILFATISKNPSEEYYVSITVECEHQPLKSTGKQIGIDLGIETLAVGSDGTKLENIRTTKQYEKKLAYQQKMLASKQKESKRRQIQKVKVAKVYERIKNIRLNHLHNISSKLVRENQTICFESLLVLNMMKNHCLAKAIADAGWSELIRQIKYKSEWNDRENRQIDRFFPSSKTCSVCGYIHYGMSLSVREWDCPQCKTHHNRDENASFNILKEGLNLESGTAIVSDIKRKGREASGCKQSLRTAKPRRL